MVSNPPRRIGSIAFPTSTPYIVMLAPAARSSVANLCFAGTSDSRVYDWERKEICSPRRRSASAISTLSFESSLSTLFCITLSPVFSLFTAAYSHGAAFPLHCRTRCAINPHFSRESGPPGRHVGPAFRGGPLLSLSPYSAVLSRALDSAAVSISKTWRHFSPAGPLSLPPCTWRGNPLPHP